MKRVEGIKAAKWTILVLAASLIAAAPTLIMLLHATGAEEISISDEADDVLRTGYVDTKAGGNPELDIISLRSTESISDVTIVMECYSDIESGVGYLYTISVSGIHVSYQEGAFEVWKIGSELQPVDNVLTGVTDREMTVIVKKTAIAGEFVMNGTANRYVIDWTKGATSESYYDRIGDMGETRAPVVGEFTRSYSDPSGDVRLVYLDVEPVEEPGLDILGVAIEISGDILVTLELAGEPLTAEGTSYTVYILDGRIVWSGGSAEFIREGEAALRLVSTSDDTSISMTIPSGSVPGEPGGLVVQTRRTIDDDTFLEDLLPDDPYTISELLPFPPGSARELSLEIAGPHSVLMTRSYSGFPSQAVEDIRSSIDGDEDGSVDEDEIEAFFQGSLDSIRSEHAGDLLMDSRTGDLQVVLRHEGLAGPVGPGGRIVIGWEMNYSFEVSGGGHHEIELDIDHYDTSLLPSPGPGEEEASYKVVLRTAKGWGVDPLTLEPSELANHLDLEGRSLEYTISGSDARTFDAGSISIGIRPDGDDPADDDDGSGGGDDLLWLYILIFSIMVVVVAGLLVWSRRDEP